MISWQLTVEVSIAGRPMPRGHLHKESLEVSCDKTLRAEETENNRAGRSQRGRCESRRDGILPCSCLETPYRRRSQIWKSNTAQVTRLDVSGPDDAEETAVADVDERRDGLTHPERVRQQ